MLLTILSNYLCKFIKGGVTLGITGVYGLRGIDKTTLILPTVYEDTLSYLEQFRMITDRFNKLVDIVDKEDSDIQKLKNDLYELTRLHNELVDRVGQLESAVQSEIHNILSKLESYRKDMLLRLAELRDYVDNQNQKIKDELQTLKNYLLIAIDKATHDSMIYTNSKVDALKALHELDIDAINKRIDNITLEFDNIYNPITGERDSIDDVVIYLYRYLRDDCCSAIEYDTLGLSAKEYDDMSISAINYDICSYLIMYGRDNKMYSPFTGEYTTTKRVIRELFDAININGKTAEQYDNMSITANDFDNSDYSAWEHDTNQYYQSTPNDNYPMVYNTTLSGLRPLIINEDGLPSGNYAIDRDIKDFAVKVKTNSYTGQYFFSSKSLHIAGGSNKNLFVLKLSTDTGTSFDVGYNGDNKPTVYLSLIGIYEVTDSALKNKEDLNNGQ